MLSRDTIDLQMLINFLHTPTPNEWLNAAVEKLPLLLIDHAHCERKAATTALNFITQYPQMRELVDIMSPLAREELLHFEKVLLLLTQRQINFKPLAPSRYAQAMHHLISSDGGMKRLRDQLLVGAIIEARSCERFNALIPMLSHDEPLKKFYCSLVQSEARHFQNYIHLAKHYGGNIDEQLNIFIDLENKFILSDDQMFRLHSGIPY